MAATRTRDTPEMELQAQLAAARTELLGLSDMVLTYLEVSRFLATKPPTPERNAALLKLIGHLERANDLARIGAGLAVDPESKREQISALLRDAGSLARKMQQVRETPLPPPKQAELALDDGPVAPAQVDTSSAQSRVRVAKRVVSVSPEPQARSTAWSAAEALFDAPGGEKVGKG